MIEHDQPTIFGDKLVVAVSSVHNGPMNFKGNDPEEVRANRLAFFDQAGVDPLASTLVQVTYDDTTDFTRYKIVGEEQVGEGILEPMSNTEADALVAVRPEHGLFLPLADCIGAVIFDPENEILMVSHLGRHSAEQNGGAKSIEFLVSEFGSDPASLLVWLSPAVGRRTYPLEMFGGRGLHEVIAQQILRAGVGVGNMEVSAVDTASSDDYYSHSEFKAGNQHEDGRFAILAMMVE